MNKKLYQLQLLLFLLFFFVHKKAFLTYNLNQSIGWGNDLSNLTFLLPFISLILLSILLILSTLFYYKKIAISSSFCYLFSFLTLALIGRKILFLEMEVFILILLGLSIFYLFYSLTKATFLRK